MQETRNITQSLIIRTWRPWIIVLVVCILALGITLIGTYTLNWTWTGFRGNTLWDWLHLLIIPTALTIAKVFLSLQRKWRQSLVVGIWSALLTIALLEIATFVFNWSWTGFEGNTLWDWLNLLLLPLMVTLTSAWFSAPPIRRLWWARLILGTLVMLAPLTLASYLFNWTWTGLIGNTLWDWLSLLLVPVVLISVTIWFTDPQARVPREITNSLKLLINSDQSSDSISESIENMENSEDVSSEELPTHRG